MKISSSASSSRLIASTPRARDVRRRLLTGALRAPRAARPRPVPASVQRRELRHLLVRESSSPPRRTICRLSSKSRLMKPGKLAPPRQVDRLREPVRSAAPSAPSSSRPSSSAARRRSGAAAADWCRPSASPRESCAIAAGCPAQASVTASWRFRRSSFDGNCAMSARAPASSATASRPCCFDRRELEARIAAAGRRRRGRLPQQRELPARAPARGRPRASRSRPAPRSAFDRAERVGLGEHLGAHSARGVRSQRQPARIAHERSGDVEQRIQVGDGRELRLVGRQVPGARAPRRRAAAPPDPRPSAPQPRRPPRPPALACCPAT